MLSDSTDVNDLHFFLSQLDAPIGVFSVDGNWEHWVGREKLRKAMAGSKINDLTNKRASIRDDLDVLGFDDEFVGQPDRSISQIDSASSTKFRIALIHSPAFFDTIHPVTDLVLAGHTHGGQVFLPIVGALWLPKGSGQYVKGWYSKENSRMYVSRGIGTSIVPIRIGARPELAIIYIKAEK